MSDLVWLFLTQLVQILLPILCIRWTFDWIRIFLFEGK